MHYLTCVRDSSRLRTALVVGLLLAWTRGNATASCATDCTRRMAECRQTACAGATRRACRDTCRALTGCAAGGARIRTLASVVTECHSDPAIGWTARQRLEIRRGTCAPVTVMEIEASVPVPDPLALCALYGQYRGGTAYVIGGGFQRLAVSPDGRLVVFELTNDHVYAPFAPPPFSLPEQGMFVVRADGRELRSLGPASRQSLSRVTPSPLPPGIDIFVAGGFEFSPKGDVVLLADRGPGADGTEAGQLVTLDVQTGRRKQLTAFVAASQAPETGIGGFFLDAETIGGAISSTYFTVKKDGSDLRTFAPPTPILGSKLVPNFQLAGQARQAQVFTLPAITTVPFPGNVQEAFVSDGTNVLQLTSFGRTDTVPVASSPDGERLFLAASADPFGHNALNVCQFFSLDRFGGHLRQLTFFRPSAASEVGCFKPTAPPSCRIDVTEARFDAKTNALVFPASCDPFGMNPLGGQLFAVRTDGSGLRQLTAHRGMVTQPDGTVTVELPGPIGYSAH
ncbi:MAG: hypothetical protein ACREQL_00655 [Candidatus Binatia bacterium]